MTRLVLGMVAALLAAPLSAEAKRDKPVLVGAVNLNTASAAELELLPGVGEKAAKDIIAYRQQRPFKRIEDIVRVRGFGKKRFERMRAHLAVVGNTTLRVERAGRTTAGRGPPRR